MGIGLAGELASERGRTGQAVWLGNTSVALCCRGMRQSCICLPKTVLSGCLSSTLPSSWASNKRAAFSSTPKPKNILGTVVDMPSERLLVILAIGRGAVISTGPDIQEIPIGLLLESDQKFPLAQKAINCPAWGMGLSKLGSP